MKRLIGLLAGMVMLGGSVQAHEFPHAPNDLPQLMGADIFVDLAQYAGKQVIITDGTVWGANQDGGYLHAGGVTFRVSIEGIDRETFRYLLKNCHELSEPTRCSVHLLATPTGKFKYGKPELIGAKIVR